MPTIDWDKWNRGWATGLPKNQMWAKIRTGRNDESGEPTFQYESRVDTTSVDPQVTDILAEHRFVAPAVETAPNTEHCFCGWTGQVHADHLDEKVQEFLNPPAQNSPKKASAKKVDE